MFRARSIQSSLSLKDKILYIGENKTLFNESDEKKLFELSNEESLFEKSQKIQNLVFQPFRKLSY